jgi:hypothetical protein
MLAIEEIKDIVGEIAEEFDEAIACGDMERAAELAREQSVATDIWLAKTEDATEGQTRASLVVTGQTGHRS